MKGILWIWLILMHLPMFFHAQELSGDSLMNNLDKAGSTDKKIRMLLALADHNKSSDPEAALAYLARIKPFFWEINSMPYLGTYYRLRATIFLDKGDWKEALRNYNLSLVSYRRSNDREQQTRVLLDIGNAHITMGNIPEAFKFYLQGKDLAEQTGDDNMLGRISNNLGGIFITLKQHESGILYYKKALEELTKQADSAPLSSVLLNIGLAYYHISNLDSAWSYAQKALDMSFRIKRTLTIGTTYELCAFILIKEKKYQEALEYLQKARQIAVEQTQETKSSKAKALLADVHVYLGLTYSLTGDIRRAKSNLLTGYRLASGLNNLERINEVSEHLSTVYEKSGNPDSALYYYKSFKRNTDSLTSFKTVNIARLAAIEMNYEKEVKEKQLQLEYSRSIQNRNLVIFLGAGIILVALIVILFLRLRISNHRKIQAQLEKKQSESEKQTIAMMLENQNKELATKVMFATSMKEIVLNVAEKIQQLEIDEDTPNHVVKTELIHDLIHSASIEDNWKEFELRFQNVHSDFYRQLRERFANLTTNEIRLAALLRLNMNTKEISAITHQTERAIVLSRHRLRQKLGLQKSDNLITFLSQF